MKSIQWESVIFFSEIEYTTSEYLSSNGKFCKKFLKIVFIER